MIFCKPVEYGDGKETVRNIKVEPIDMGGYEDVLRLEVWFMNNEAGENPKLQICLSMPDANVVISTMDIPIKYCPICGRKI